MPRRHSSLASTPLVVGAALGLAVGLLVIAAPSASNAAAATTTPVVSLLMSSPELSGYACAFDDASYQLAALLTPNQGTVPTQAGLHWALNPGSDIDLTVTTDFEDVAAPVADVSEFSNQERALLTDSLASTVFWNGLMGVLTGMTLRLLLSPAFWRALL